MPRIYLPLCQSVMGWDENASDFDRTLGACWGPSGFEAITSRLNDTNVQANCTSGGSRGALVPIGKLHYKESSDSSEGELLRLTEGPIGVQCSFMSGADRRQLRFRRRQVADCQDRFSNLIRQLIASGERRRHEKGELGMDAWRQNLPKSPPSVPNMASVF